MDLVTPPRAGELPDLGARTMPCSSKVHLLLLTLCFVGAAGCGSGDLGGGKSGLTAVSIESVSANPNNVLSAVVAVNVRNAAKIRVTYQPAGGLPISTPDTALGGGTSLSVPVFGLRPDTTYSIWASAIASSGSSLDSPQESFHTGSLPTSLPTFWATKPGTPAAGYTMVAWTMYPLGEKNAALIVDQSGEIAWYKELTDFFVLDWQRQPNGNYTAALDRSVPPFEPDGYREFDKQGNQLRTWSGTDNCRIDDHELRLLPNGDALYFCINSRTVDLTSLGGRPDAMVLGNVLIRKSSNNEVLFQWDAFDHLSVTDSLDALIDPTSETVDWTHGNAIEVSADGNYLLSFRNISQVVKVDSHTGGVLWKLGGRDGNFTFVDDPLNGFSLQHAIRELVNGNLTLFDNGAAHDPAQSRAAEYQLDVGARRARLVWQYDADPILYTFAMGFVQRLGNGNTLVTYGLLPEIREVNAAGDLQWALQPFDPNGFIYRSFRIASLY
jgi:hypothetical protein